MLLQRIETQIDNYVDDYGETPRFLILDPMAYTELVYEITKKMKITEEEKLTYDLQDYSGMIIAVTSSTKFSYFEVR